MSENKTEKKETNSKEKGDNTVKICMGIATLAVLTPAMFPALALPTVAVVAPYVTGAGVACLSGISAFLALDVIKEMRKEDVNEEGEDFCEEANSCDDEDLK